MFSLREGLNSDKKFNIRRMTGRNNGEIVRWNGVMSMVDVCLDARKGRSVSYIVPVKGETPMCSEIRVNGAEFLYV